MYRGCLIPCILECSEHCCDFFTRATRAVRIIKYFVFSVCLCCYYYVGNFLISNVIKFFSDTYVIFAFNPCISINTRVIIYWPIKHPRAKIVCKRRSTRGVRFCTFADNLRARSFRKYKTKLLCYLYRHVNILNHFLLYILYKK